MSSTTYSDHDPDYQQAILHIRGLWEFANVSQFMHTYCDAFGLDSFDTDELERSLATDDNIQVGGLIMKMLRTLSFNKTISLDNWEQHLHQQYQKYAPEKNPFGDEICTIKFEDISVKQKVLILHDLCQWQMRNPERFRNLLSNQDNPQEWRVTPVGYDSKGNTYWLFDDNRLCKESPKKDVSKKQKSKVKNTRRSRAKHVTPEVNESIAESTNWETVCVTIAEWEEFPKRFEKSRNAQEKAFYKLLTEDLLPPILAALQEREKERKKLDALANRKRSSRIQKRELEKQEADRAAQIKKDQDEREEKAKQMEFAKIKAEKDREERSQARERRSKERELRLLARDDKIKKEQETIIEKQHDMKVKRVNDIQDHLTPPDTTLHVKTQQAEDWYFDCLCGISGTNINDGSNMIACDRCAVWQHLDCLLKTDERFRQTRDFSQIEYVCARCLQSQAIQSSTPASNNEHDEIIDVVKIDSNDVIIPPIQPFENILRLDQTVQEMNIDLTNVKRPIYKQENQEISTLPIKERKRPVKNMKKSNNNGIECEGKNTGNNMKPKSTKKDGTERATKRRKKDTSQILPTPSAVGTTPAPNSQLLPYLQTSNFILPSANIQPMTTINYRYAGGSNTYMTGYRPTPNNVSAPFPVNIPYKTSPSTIPATTLSHGHTDIYSTNASYSSYSRDVGSFSGVDSTKDIGVATNNIQESNEDKAEDTWILPHKKDIMSISNLIE
ncbi:Zinc finger, PHD-type, conserved site [Gigaspora margarita]|uniref:Zinc finger, PHD-type, conserved site n=1 Tax=Gigaspora margarita TaxID=4874 RepID=A0A8H4AG83_GIGMA|nr:Zinc finger, PHD-type, conserved site [Gigaspora margarita]